MPGFNIAIITDYYHGRNSIEAIEIKEALQFYDNEIMVFHEIDGKLGKKLQDNNIDLVFNLARNRYKKNHEISIAAICELLEINFIGPKIISSLIVENKPFLYKVLNFEGIKTIDKNISKNQLKSISVSTLGNDCDSIFVLDLHSFDNNVDSFNYEKIKNTCKKSFKTIQATDFCEFLFFIDQEDNLMLSDINLMPFLDKKSNLSMFFNMIGLGYIDLINFIILNACNRSKLEISESYRYLEEKLYKKAKISVNHPEQITG